MYAWACMYVCMYVEHVCMYVCMYVKLSSKRVGLIPYEKRSVLNVLFNFLRFVRGGTSRCPDMHTYMLSIHTYIAVLKNSSQGEGFWKNPHRERGFEKPLTGRRVLKFNIHTYSLSNQLFSKVVHFKTPLPVRAFAFQQQHNSRCSEPKPLSLWGFLAFLTLPRSLHALKYVCMFQTPLPVRVFVTNIPTYSLSSQHEAQS